LIPLMGALKPRRRANSPPLVIGAIKVAVPFVCCPFCLLSLLFQLSLLFYLRFESILGPQT
jgi:hypothetical protein